MTLNVHIQRTIAAFGIVGALAFGAWAGSAIGNASPSHDRYDSPSVTMTVDGTDYPVCYEEDCSDQPGQVGVWYSEYLGAWLLELGADRTFVVDASVDQSGYDAGYENALTLSGLHGWLTVWSTHSTHRSRDAFTEIRTATGFGIATLTEIAIVLDIEPSSC